MMMMMIIMTSVCFWMQLEWCQVISVHHEDCSTHEVYRQGPWMAKLRSP